MEWATEVQRDLGKQDQLEVALNRARSGPAHLFIEGRNWTREVLGLRRADAARSHLSNLIIGAGNADIAILDGLDSLAKPVTVDLLRAHTTEVSSNTNEKQGDCSCNHHSEVLHDRQLMLYHADIDSSLGVVGIWVYQIGPFANMNPQTSVNGCEECNGSQSMIVRTVSSIGLLNRYERRNV